MKKNHLKKYLCLPFIMFFLCCPYAYGCACCQYCYDVPDLGFGLQRRISDLESEGLIERVKMIERELTVYKGEADGKSLTGGCGCSDEDEVAELKVEVSKLNKHIVELEREMRQVRQQLNSDA